MERVCKKLYYRVRNSIYNRLDWQQDEKFLKSLINIWAMKFSTCISSIATIDETLDMLINTQCSMSRFGDGEIKVMLGGGNYFQSADAVLAQRLRQILRDNKNNGVLICIPNIKEQKQINSNEGQWFYKSFVRKNGLNWVKLMNHSGKYYDASVSRCYLEIKDKALSQKWFSKWKLIWNQKDILIVEGESTKFGIGNDLISNAKSVKRIICPSKDAFSCYSEILNSTISNNSGELVLCALGMTASVLAYDLNTAGIRALDIGHLDNEYDWYKIGCLERVKVKGKHTAEMPEDNSCISDEDKKIYGSQIIATIMK